MRGSTHRNKRPGTAAHDYLLRVENGLPVGGLMGRIDSGIETDFDDHARAEATDNDADDFEGVDNVRGMSFFRLFFSNGQSADSLYNMSSLLQWETRHWVA
jgi:hypothetical protein